MGGTVAIVQARMGSSRLPGKSMADIVGLPMIQRVINRLERTYSLDGVCVATSTDPGDDAIAAHCEAQGVTCVRGSELDVLSRFILAIEATNAETVVRVTADCPLIDPGLLDRIVKTFLQDGCDFVSNVLTCTFPRGVEAEVCAAETLYTAHREAEKPFEREHVMPFIYTRPQRYGVCAVTAPPELFRPHYRLCVDTEADLNLVREVYTRLGAEGLFGLPDIVDLLDNDRYLAVSNSHVHQKKYDE